MAPGDTALEVQLLEAGNRLLQPPSSVDDLLLLLDQVECFLSRVEQSPSTSMRNAVFPSIKALVADKFLRHPNADVKVAVASCISEITRITAPDAPYDDDQMRDVFQLIVSSCENLSDKSSKSYDKRTLILEILAKVRSCVVMLDLECDQLIVEMFQNFLKAIRDYHPDNVFSSMETIMTLILEESEDISFELIFPILDSLKRDNQEVLPIARKLGERVLENCARMLKPYLIHAKKSLGFSLDEYSNVVASICGGTGAVGHTDDNACSEQLNQVTGESVTKTHPGENSVDRHPKSVLSNGVAETGNEDGLTYSESSKRPDYAHQADQSVDTNGTSTARPDDSDNVKIVKLESNSQKTAKERGRKPKSLISSTEPADSQVDSDNEAERMAGHAKIRSKEACTSHSEEPSAEVIMPSEIEKGSIQLSSPKVLENEPMNVTSPSPNGSVPGEGRPKKARRQKKKAYLIQEVATSADVSKKASEGKNDMEVKPQRRSGKRAEKTVAPADKSKGEGVTTSDSEAKPLEQSGSKADVSKSIRNGSSSKKKEDGKRRGRAKATSEKDVTKASIEDDAKETVSSPNPKDEGHLEEIPKTKGKRKPEMEKASDTIEYGDNLVGSKIQVWWPDDQMFYEGVIDYFDSVKKKHKVSYADGDDELLDLSNERWEFARGESVPDREQLSECRSPVPSLETHKKKKAKTNSEPAFMRGNMKGSRGGETSSSKLKGTSTKSGLKSMDASKGDGKSKDKAKSGGDSQDDNSGKPEERSKNIRGKSGDAARKAGKLKDVDGGKTRIKSKQDTPKTVTKDGLKAATKSKGKASKSGNKSNANGPGKVKETEGKEKSPEMVKKPERGKGQETGTKSGKKRRRGAKS